MTNITLSKEQIEYQKWAWKVVDRLLTMATVIAATDTEMLRSKEEIQRELAEELSKISLAKFQEAFLPSMALALQAIDMRPHVAQFGEGKLEVILGELESEGNVYIVPAKHQGKVGEITPPELRAARDVWHDGEIVLKFPNQLQALKVAAALTNVKPEDWVFEESMSPLSALPTSSRVMLKTLARQRKAIPVGELMPFECPKCKAVKFVQSIVFIDWGAPNCCDKCGQKGFDFKVAKSIRPATLTIEERNDA